LRRFRAESPREQDALHLMRCSECGSEYLAPQPSDASLAAEYASYRVKRRSGTRRPKLTYFRRLLADTGIEFSGKRVVDLGASEGDCVAALNTDWPNAACVAVEPGAHAFGHYEDLRCELAATTVEDWASSTNGNPADVLIMFDLLEHLRTPVETLRTAVARCLRDGGIVLATFPNADSLSRRLLGSLWPQYKLEHLHYFSKRGVDALARVSGLTSRTIAPLTKRLPVDYVLSVGTNTGPRPIRAMSRAVRALTPETLDAVTIPARFGEWLWIAERQR